MSARDQRRDFRSTTPQDTQRHASSAKSQEFDSSGAAQAAPWAIGMNPVSNAEQAPQVSRENVPQSSGDSESQRSKKPSPPVTRRPEAPSMTGGSPVAGRAARPQANKGATTAPTSERAAESSGKASPKRRRQAIREASRGATPLDYEGSGLGLNSDSYKDILMKRIAATRRTLQKEQAELQNMERRLQQLQAAGAGGTTVSKGAGPSARLPEIEMVMKRKPDPWDCRKVFEDELYRLVASADEPRTNDRIRQYRMAMDEQSRKLIDENREVLENNTRRQAINRTRCTKPRPKENRNQIPTQAEPSGAAGPSTIDTEGRAASDHNTGARPTRDPAELALPTRGFRIVPFQDPTKVKKKSLNQLMSTVAVQERVGDVTTSGGPALSDPAQRHRAQDGPASSGPALSRQARGSSARRRSEEGDTAEKASELSGWVPRGSSPTGPSRDGLARSHPAQVVTSANAPSRDSPARSDPAAETPARGTPARSGPSDPGQRSGAVNPPQAQASPPRSNPAPRNPRAPKNPASARGSGSTKPKPKSAAKSESSDLDRGGGNVVAPSTPQASAAGGSGGAAAASGRSSLSYKPPERSRKQRAPGKAER